MSVVFDAYARYYDLLYRDKDYAAEVEYVVSHIRRHVPGAKKILELGCGTGAHAEHLSRHGFTVHGVDLSETMLAGAEAQKQALPPNIAGRMSFSQGDARSVKLGEQYDVVLSLFHVMSYQTTNADLSAALATAAAHLVPSGVFLFDFWYGPAVLTQRPDVRVKRLEDNEILVTRIAEPVLRENENVVDVNYDICIEKRKGGIERIVETHRMRYWFVPELALYLQQAGFEQCAVEAWLSDQPPSIASWTACITARLR